MAGGASTGSRPSFHRTGDQIMLTFFLAVVVLVGSVFLVAAFLVALEMLLKDIFKALGIFQRGPRLW